MYGLTLKHPQAWQNCTRSYKKRECISTQAYATRPKGSLIVANQSWFHSCQKFRSGTLNFLVQVMNGHQSIIVNSNHDLAFNFKWSVLFHYVVFLTCNLHTMHVLHVHPRVYKNSFIYFAAVYIAYNV